MAKVQKVGREAGHQVTNPKGLSQTVLRWLIARWESQVPVQATVERLELWMCFPWVFLGDERVYRVHKWYVKEIDQERAVHISPLVLGFQVVDAGSGQDVLSKGLDAVKARVSLAKTGQHVAGALSLGKANSTAYQRRMCYSKSFQIFLGECNCTLAKFTCGLGPHRRVDWCRLKLKIRAWYHWCSGVTKQVCTFTRNVLGSSFQALASSEI